MLLTLLFIFILFLIAFWIWSLIMNGFCKRDEDMTVKDWLAVFGITSIPIVGIIFNFIWAFDDNINLSKKNFAWASIYIGIASVTISILRFSAVALELGRNYLK